MAGVNRYQVGIQFLVIGHACHDAYSHACPYIGLDHIGISRGKHNLRPQSGIVKRAVQL